tara:strand:- start:1012 stop:1404 length:393 start_codon:yes stop_codon:yes gene_type:complete
MGRKLRKEASRQLSDLKYRVTENSYLGLQPGDLIQFDYVSSSRLGLVVSSKRTSRGYFLSTQNNTLLNIVEVDGLTGGMFSLMINNLYKNRVACNYYSPRIIGMFLGDDNFKTFNIAKVHNILEVNIGKV